VAEAQGLLAVAVEAIVVVGDRVSVAEVVVLGAAAIVLGDSQLVFCPCLFNTCCAT
jgi:hypothetical protein